MRNDLDAMFQANLGVDYSSGFLRVYHVPFRLDKLGAILMDSYTKRTGDGLRVLRPESFGLAWGAATADVLDAVPGRVVSTREGRVTVLVKKEKYDLLISQDGGLWCIRHCAFESLSIPEDDEVCDIAPIYQKTFAVYTTLVGEYTRLLGSPTFSGRYEPRVENGYPENAGGDWLSQWRTNGHCYRLELISELEGGPFFVYESAETDT